MGSESENKNDEKVSNGNWWEFYVVRYALGTLLGALILYVLSKSNLQIPSQQIIDTESVKGYPLLILFGLGFCYLASAPILVFHAGRFASPGSNSPARKRVFVIFLSAITLMVFLFFYLNKKETTNALIFLAAPLYLIVMLQQYCALTDLLRKQKDMWQFYLKLDRNRRNTKYKGLVDSYRHLREHGNAFFVAALELLLGLCIYLAGTVNLLDPNSPKMNFSTFLQVFQMLLIVIIWIAPAAIVWNIANNLEMDFANETDFEGKPEAEANSMRY